MQVGETQPGEFPGTTEPPVVTDITIKDGKLTRDVNEHLKIQGKHEIVVHIRGD